MANQFPISVPPKNLALSLTSAATSFQLNNVLGWDMMALDPAAMPDRMWAIFINSGKDTMEIMRIDPTTVASASITIIKRGLSFTGGDTEVAANKLDWNAGETTVLLGTNPPQLYEDYVDRYSDETIGGIKTFSSYPIGPSANPTTAFQLATKQYVDSLSLGGATYDQNIIAGTAGETLAAGKIVYFKSADQRWWLATQATAATCIGVQLGVAQGTATAGAAVNVLIGGIDKNQSGLTAGNDYYLGAAGAVSTSAGATNEVFLGRASSTTILIFVPWFSKAFLGDDVSIKLGAGNKLITQTGFQNHAETYATSSGSANAYVLTLTPAPVALVAGQEFEFKANFANTGAATLNVNSLGAIAIKKVDGATALVSGDIANGQTVKVKYDGTNFQMISPVGNAATGATYKHGVTSYDLTTASGTQNIAHGLGTTPKYVVIKAILGAGGGAPDTSEGIYNGSTTSTLIFINAGSFYAPGARTDTTSGVFLTNTSGSDFSQKAVITFDGTNIILTWTKTGSPTGTARIQWQAFA